MSEDTTGLYAAWTDPDRQQRVTGDALQFSQALREQPPSVRHRLVNSVRWSLWPYADLTAWADPSPTAEEDEE